MGWEAEGGGWGGRWQKLVNESAQNSSTVKIQSPEQPTVGHEIQWTQPWSRV